MSLLAKGYRRKEAAEELGYSRSGLNKRVWALCEYYGVYTDAGLIAKVIRAGVI